MDLISILQHAFSSDEADILKADVATSQYGKTTFSCPIPISAGVVVFQPKAIATLLKLANEHKFHIFPISSGNNWGYGSIQGIDSAQIKVVLDLGKLKKITPTSKELGLITLEPGVTQQDLYRYLEDNNWPFMTPVTGAGPNCCIVSNAIERGYGITPRTDHFMAINALKAYLPHPELCDSVYSSAVSEMDKSGNDFIDKTYKWGLGPYLDGLFTQSNFGVVTEMTLRLAPKPKHFSTFYIQIFNEDNFEQAVHFIQQFLLDFEGIVGSINLMDKNRLISMTTGNPNSPSSHTIMSRAQITQIAKNNKLPCWMVVGSLYGSKAIVKSAKAKIKTDMSKFGALYFSDSALLKIAKKIFSLPLPSIKLIISLQNQLNSLDEGMEIMLGKPNQIALPLAYWRNPRVSPDKSKDLLPARDECGLLWYAPLLPMDSKKLSKFVKFIRNTTPKYNIEPLITFTNLRHDCIDATVPIVFDLGNDKAKSDAHACLDELISTGCEMGFVPYRLNTDQQAKLDKNTIFWKIVNEMKKTLDPNNIISPERYNPK